MVPKTVNWMLAACLGAAFACSPGPAGTDAGTSSTSGGSTSSGGSSGSSGGSTSGGSGEVATSCTIADAGAFDAGAVNPVNPCQVCDPSTDAGVWSPNVVCSRCQLGGKGGICDMIGNCCLAHCGGGGNCEDADGGVVANSTCGIDSDCCGISPSVSAGNNGC